jgi:hypothetical protein
MGALVRIRPCANPRAQAQLNLRKREISERGRLSSGHEHNCTGRQRDLVGIDVYAHSVAGADEMDGGTPRPLLSTDSRHC